MHLPKAFIERTKAILAGEWDDFERSLQEPPPVSIRFNRAKMEDGAADPEWLSDPVPWADGAFYLKERPIFTLDPLFHAGCYYVQEASSMFLGKMVKKTVRGAVRALDLCAAPGGKSTHLSATLPAGSLLVANEVIRSRVGVLSENLIKWGSPRTIVTSNDPKEFGGLTSFFDLIVADVPCSGEGMFRKDPASVSEWSLRNVQLCAERQRRIIADVWPALAPGGILLYSTCTYNREENEENIDWICKEQGAVPVDAPHRFMPHRTKGEGFFIAALRKTKEENRPVRLDRKTRSASGKGEIFPEKARSFLTNPDEFACFREGSVLRAIPAAMQEDYLLLKGRLKVVSAGVDLGEIKGRDLIPSPALALSTSLRRDAFPVWEVDREIARRYLRKEAFDNLPQDLPAGYILVSYRNHPLGFLKNIGNRANNLYPREWRIRTDRTD